jgi:ankyrin repeat protein
MNTALNRAVLTENFVKVKELVSQGADIQANNNFALQLAAQNDNIDIFTFLIDNGADIHAENNLALMLAVKKGNIKIVKTLVNYGINIHAEDAFINAVLHGHLELVKFFVRKGADIHVNDNRALLYSTYNRDSKIFNYLISLGAILPQSCSKEFMLESAAKRGNVDTVKYLVSQGANIHIDNDSVLRHAAFEKEVIDYLISQGADIENAIDYCDNNYERAMLENYIKKYL